MEPDDSIYMKPEQETGKIRTIVIFLVVLSVSGARWLRRQLAFYRMFCARAFISDCFGDSFLFDKLS